MGLVNSLKYGVALGFINFNVITTTNKYSPLHVYLSLLPSLRGCPSTTLPVSRRWRLTWKASQVRYNPTASPSKYLLQSWGRLGRRNTEQSS